MNKPTPNKIPTSPHSLFILATLGRKPCHLTRQVPHHLFTPATLKVTSRSLESKELKDDLALKLNREYVLRTGEKVKVIKKFAKDLLTSDGSRRFYQDFVGATLVEKEKKVKIPKEKKEKTPKPPKERKKKEPKEPSAPSLPSSHQLLLPIETLLTPIPHLEPLLTLYEIIDLPME